MKSTLAFERGLHRRRPDKIHRTNRGKAEDGQQEENRGPDDRETNGEEEGSYEEKKEERKTKKQTQRRTKKEAKEGSLTSSSNPRRGRSGNGAKRTLLGPRGSGKGAISPSSLTRTQKIRSGRSLSQSVKQAKRQQTHADQLMAQLQDKNQLLSLQAAELNILRKRIQQLVTEGLNSSPNLDTGVLPQPPHHLRETASSSSLPYASSSSSHSLSATSLTDVQEQHSSFHSRAPSSTVARLEYSRSTPILRHPNS